MAMLHVRGATRRIATRYGRQRKPAIAKCQNKLEGISGEWGRAPQTSRKKQPNGYVTCTRSYQKNSNEVWPAAQARNCKMSKQARGHKRGVGAGAADVAQEASRPAIYKQITTGCRPAPASREIKPAARAARSPPPPPLA